MCKTQLPNSVVSLHARRMRRLQCTRSESIDSGEDGEQQLRLSEPCACPLNGANSRRRSCVVRCRFSSRESEARMLAALRKYRFPPRVTPCKTAVRNTVRFTHGPHCLVSRRSPSIWRCIPADPVSDVGVVLNLPGPLSTQPCGIEHCSRLSSYQAFAIIEVVARRSYYSK